MKNILFIFGTRPESIKLAPLIKLFKADSRFKTYVCVTAQHRQMLDQVLDFFEIKPDFDLDLMKPNQSLLHLMAQALMDLEPVFDACKPDLVFVQGDTTTVLVGAMVAFHKQVKIAHIEAGLRSFDKWSPFPEEMNRLLCSRLSDYHFAPTPKAAENLLSEGINNQVFMVGNTVIDALQQGIEVVGKQDDKFFTFFQNIDFQKKIILVTCHRRESFGEPFVNICEALLSLADEYPDTEIVYPVHLNPNVKEVAHKLLIRPNIKLIPPLDYPYLIWLMNQSYMILTDSGGIQEEAPSLGKPILVLRNITERMEGIEAGTAKLVGTDKNHIIKEAKILLENRSEYEKMSNAVNPYGDGTSCQQILDIIAKTL